MDKQGRPEPVVAPGGGAPSAAAAAASGAVGPGALAAAEGHGPPDLTPEEAEMVRAVAMRVGTDALVRWLQQQVG